MVLQGTVNHQRRSRRKRAYCCLDEVAKHGRRLRTRQKMRTTVRARIVTGLEFRIGNERRESRRDCNRDGGLGSVWLAVASTALNERRRGGTSSEAWISVRSLCCLVCISRLFSLLIATTFVGNKQVWSFQFRLELETLIAPSRILIRVEGPTLATTASEYCSLMAIASGPHVGRWMCAARHVCHYKML